MRPFTVAGLLLFTIVLLAIPSLAAPDASPASQPATKAPAEPAAKAPVKAEAPEAPKDVVSGVSTVVSLFKEHKWRPAIAALLMLLVFIWRRFLGGLLIKKIPAKHMAWVTAAMGLLAALPAHLTVEHFSVWKFLLDGFVTGAQAAILWSMLGKHFLPKVFGEVKNG